MFAPSGSGKTVASKTLVEPINLQVHEIARLFPRGERRFELFVEDATREATIEHLVVCPVAVVHSDGLDTPLPLPGRTTT